MSAWTEIQLGDVFQVKHGWAFKGEFFRSEGELIVVTPGNFYEQGGFRVRDGKEKFYSGKFPLEYLLSKGDVVIAMTEQGPGLLGSPGIIPEDNKFLHNQRIGLITDIDTARIGEKFIYYLFFTSAVRNEIFSSSTGTKVKHTAPKRIYNISVKIPDLSAQHKIASILSAYDDLIENNMKRIKLLEEIAQRTYEEWFVKFRVGGEELAIDYKTGLPEGWELKEIQFFGKVVTGKTPSTLNAANFDGTVPFVKTPDMHGLPYVIKTNQTLSRLGAELQSKKFIPKNSIMVSCIGSAGVYALASTDCQTNQQINAVDFFKPHYSFYFYCLAGNLKPLLEGLGSNGATMTNVNKGKFEKINVIHPGDEILIDFHEKIKSNFELILTMQKQNEILKEARDILLPRLMSGEIDVEEMALAAVATK